MTIENILLENRSISSAKKIGIAVSGGVDSMALLYAFNKIKKKTNLDLYALHFNHGWRADSKKDGKLIEDFCKNNGITFVSKKASASSKKTEENARKLRYQFFKASAKSYKLDMVCTAHHLDDQVETIIFRLARGAGPGGFDPIKRESVLLENIVLCRPLLDVSKKSVIQYAKKKKIAFNEDSTNDDVKYKRNLIRKEVLPLLNEINNSASGNLLKTSRLISCAHKISYEYLVGLCVSSNKVNRKKFLKLSSEEKELFIYNYINSFDVKGALSKIDLVIRSIEDVKPLDLSKSLKLCFVKDSFYIAQKEVKKKSQSSKPFVKKVSLKKDIKVKLDEKRCFSISEFKKNDFKLKNKNKNLAYLNLKKIGKTSIEIRHRKSFDQFKPLGCSYKVKLKKYLIDKKVPESERENIYLLTSGNDILWIPGYTISNDVKVDDYPTHVAKIEKIK